MVMKMLLINSLGRILGCLGLKHYGFDQNEKEELADDGRYIIEQFKNDVLLSKEQSNSLGSSMGDYNSGPHDEK
jgi:hypothetical protein